MRACAPETTRSLRDEELGTLAGSSTTQRPQSVLRGRGMVIALPVDFGDVAARRTSNTPARYERLFFDDAYPFGGGSLATFWRDMSFGSFTVAGDVADWKRMPGSRASYARDAGGMGAYPGNSQALLEDAVRVNDANVDFSRYDNDGPDGRPNSGDDDGYVDSVFLIYAGTSAAESGNLDAMWPHAWRHTVATRDASANGGVIRVGRYAALPERMADAGPDGDLLTVGLAAHEYGHVLGLPDLIDGEDGAGPGQWDLMGTGVWGFEHSSRPTGLSAWSRAKLGWLTPQLLEGDHVGHALGSSYAARTAVKLPVDGEPLHEHFLVERRTKTGFDADLPGSGLLVWHVDDSIAADDASGHPRVELVAADARADGDAGDLLVPGLHLSDSSTPSTRGHAGRDSLVAIQNVQDATVDLHAGVASRAPAIDRAIETAGPQAAAPTATLTAPVAGAFVRGTITMSCTGAGNPNLNRIAFYRNSTTAISSQAVTPTAPTATMTFNFNTATQPDGPNTLACRARNTSFQWSTYSNAPVTIDNTAPTTPSITAPAAGAWVRGTANITATGTDTYLVSDMSFRVDGVENWQGPYAPASPQVQTYAWDTTLVANGAHLLSVRSQDQAGNQSAVSANVPVNVDNELPTVAAPLDGAIAPDIATQSSSSTLDANWSAGTDTVSGIAGYAWRFCTSPACGTVVASGSGAGLSASATGLTLADGTYHACVTPLDVAGNQGIEQCSDGVLVDATAPVMPTPADGVAVDIDVQSSTTALDANWAAANDGSGTGVASYDWRFCPAPSCGPILASGSGAALTASATGLTLTDGAAYVACVRAIDQLGNASAYACSDGVTVVVDTPPVMSTPTDGTALPDIDGQTSGTTLNAIWPAATDDGTVTGYDWRFCQASTACGTIVASGSTAGLSASATGLTLTNGTTYYACVRANDNAPQSSAYVCSDGVIYDVTAPTTSHGGVAPGSTVAGFLSLTSSSSDAGGIDRVEYRIDSVTRATTPAGGATTFNDPGTPFDTTTIADGNHGYRIATYDIAGNMVLSNPGTPFIVNNNPEAVLPGGAITSPAPSAALAPIQTLTANVSDDSAIVLVEWLLDGVVISGLTADKPLGGSAQATAMTSTKSWNTGAVAAGAHTLTVRITDASGNVYTTAGVAVTK